MRDRRVSHALSRFAGELEVDEWDGRWTITVEVDLPSDEEEPSGFAPVGGRPRSEEAEEVEGGSGREGRRPPLRRKVE